MDTVEQGEKENMTEPKAEDTAKPGDDELALARKQAEEYKTLAMYLKADLENYKKRAAREREEFARSANESLIMDLLDVYENLERALITARNSDDSMAKGLEMIYSSMKAALEKHGLKPIKTVGEKFDPYLHEAVMQAVDNDHEEDTILEEIQRGYTLNMKVIRCAKVKVSKRGE
ncbi:Molecular chaperone GrpE (heat shock protein) [Methanocella conradii HZ254]|uniref:Protein GrpE n=1 Tax=Methanocella conradii (strain DSM 24694 / JCM 17849 / CGMCC 1.5162 / HZ254) TaxID=1041930 RepID=H8I7S6_METCZ|nr:nucleotide exchange factor GrpE [Methanocella conradii]AFC99911.1 Molecular chaperone GrpE (heat shock protein) [Methanocella conradii HZ254]MDI6897258.1 nucleotide exchange factor GrpE [Methanocella conradii]